MQLLRQCQFILLTIFLTATSGVNSNQQNGVCNQKVSFRLISTSTSCSARTESRTTASWFDCSIACSGSGRWKSFSFNNGVCVLSESPICTVSGAVKVWTKTRGSLPLIGSKYYWVFQQRKTGAVSFAKNWADYEQGFGDENEFWGGLKNINLLSKTGLATLRIEMATLDGTRFAAEWSNFTVGDASTNYIMSYNAFLTANSNVSHDSLAHQKGSMFSTFDRDNDQYFASCSVAYGNSGFWFNSCHNINPNGLYSSIEMSSPVYMTYYGITSGSVWRTLRETRMMLSIEN